MSDKIADGSEIHLEGLGDDMMRNRSVYILEKYAFYAGSEIVMVSEDYNKVKSCFNKVLSSSKKGYGYIITEYECGKEYGEIYHGEIKDWIEIDADDEDINRELEKLSKDYSLRKIDKLKEYLKEDDRLIPYIHYITPIIKKYFPTHKKYMTYCIDPEFKELNSANICVIGNDALFEEEHDIMNRLKEELLYSTEFPVTVKSRISVRMWWL